MLKELKLIVTEQYVGERLDTYVSSLNSDMSRSNCQRLIKEGNVLVNGNSSKESYRVKLGDEVLVKIEPPKEAKIEAQEIPLNIIYEDNDIIVINKEKGMVVHPGNGNMDGTLVNAVLSHAKDSLSGIGGEIRPGIVHRLDKDTSGLMLVAKTEEALEKLSLMIKNKEVTRVYLALVWGIIKHEKGTIDAPIGRDINNRQKYVVTNLNSKDSITHFKVLERYSDATLIECILETGRTHQIRVHMNYIGHPVVNDPVYGNRKLFDNSGQMLHSKYIKFVHPFTGKELSFEVEPDEKFNNLLKKFKDS